MSPQQCPPTSVGVSGHLSPVFHTTTVGMPSRATQVSPGLTPAPSPPYARTRRATSSISVPRAWVWHSYFQEMGSAHVGSGECASLCLFALCCCTFHEWQSHSESQHPSQDHSSGQSRRKTCCLFSIHNGRRKTQVFLQKPRSQRIFNFHSFIALRTWVSLSIKWE